MGERKSRIDACAQFDNPIWDERRSVGRCVLQLVSPTVKAGLGESGYTLYVRCDQVEHAQTHMTFEGFEGFDGRGFAYMVEDCCKAILWTKGHTMSWP